MYQELPGYLQAATHADIPRDSQFSDEARSTIKEDIKKAILKLGLGYLMTLFDSWDNFDDFEKILQSLNRGRLKILEDDRWMTDEVFGSMFLNGVNPNIIQRCEKLPKNFPVTEEMVKSCMNRGTTLQEEMQVCFTIKRIVQSAHQNNLLHRILL